jgi:predicted RNA-binding Zn-ribbon protein involved in translation (DUF1610 family)
MSNVVTNYGEIMAARDKYITEILCPNCGEKGALHLSEDNHPYIKKIHRAVDMVEGAFQATIQGDVKVNILCDKCGCQFEFK